MSYKPILSRYADTFHALAISAVDQCVRLADTAPDAGWRLMAISHASRSREIRRHVDVVSFDLTFDLVSRRTIDLKQ
jgi:hypothetical protein